MEDNIAAILKPYRSEIDALDNQLVDLLIKRADVIRAVAALKAEKNIPAVLEDRINEVLERCERRAQEQGKEGVYVREIYKKIIEVSCEMESNLMAKSRKAG
jgi:chorismate mutase